jgi:hypothetical protein
VPISLGLTALDGTENEKSLTAPPGGRLKDPLEIVSLWCPFV